MKKGKRLTRNRQIMERQKKANEILRNSKTRIGEQSEAILEEEEKKKKKGFIFWFKRNKARVAAGVGALIVGAGLYVGGKKLSQSGTIDPGSSSVSSEDPNKNQGNSSSSTPGYIIDEPVVDDPIIDEPIVDEPSIDEPGVDKPAKPSDVVSKPGNNSGNNRPDSSGNTSNPGIENPGEEPVHEHKFGEWTVKDDILEERRCEECEVIEYRHHNYIEKDTKSTYNGDGTHTTDITLECATDGHTIITSSKEKCYGEITYDTQYEYRTCLECGNETKTKHKLGKGVRDKNGDMLYACENEGCDYVKKVTHSYDSGSSSSGGSSEPIDPRPPKPVDPVDPVDPTPSEPEDNRTGLDDKDGEIGIGGGELDLGGSSSSSGSGSSSGSSGSGSSSGSSGSGSSSGSSGSGSSSGSSGSGSSSGSSGSGSSSGSSGSESSSGSSGSESSSGSSGSGSSNGASDSTSNSEVESEPDRGSVGIGGGELDRVGLEDASGELGIGGGEIAKASMETASAPKVDRLEEIKNELSSLYDAKETLESLGKASEPELEPNREMSMFQ